jgi:pyruvate, water dikinase
MLYTRVFQKLSRVDAELAGGKGASLGELHRAGLLVPPGFVVLTRTFNDFLRDTKLAAEIVHSLNEVDINDVSSVESTAAHIQQRIMQQTMPADIAGEIMSAFRTLKTKRVAVRSSATVEDGNTAAWAGQLETYLNTTEAELITNVMRCWASLFTPRAIVYRLTQDMKNSFISVAVVVQKMIDSEAAGVAFSVHPVTQDRNHIIIEAAFGLGEAVVSGQITPDSYVVEKQTKKVLTATVHGQSKKLVYGAAGNEWQPVTEKEQVLSEHQIQALSELVLIIEKHYGFPVDIEWAYENGSFYIVQSRPITTLEKK